jgi:hypothetical protein
LGFSTKRIGRSQAELSHYPVLLLVDEVSAIRYPYQRLPKNSMMRVRPSSRSQLIKPAAVRDRWWEGIELAIEQLRGSAG